MGAAAAAGGFIIVLFIAILGLIIFLGLWRYRKRYMQRDKGQSAMTLGIINAFMVITIIPIVMLVFSLIIINIEDYWQQKARAESDQKKYHMIDNSLTFGELVIPKGSWINHRIPQKYALHEFTDIRRSLSKARFSEPVFIKDIPIAAFEFTHNGIIVELAKAYHYQDQDGEHSCQQGWVMMLDYPEGIHRNQQYEDVGFDWFQPSQWNINHCFETSNGVMVVAINQYGLYVLKNTPIILEEPE